MYKNGHRNFPGSSIEKKIIKTFTRDIYDKYHYKTCYPKKESYGVKLTKTVNPIKCFMYVLDTKLFLAIAI